MKSKTDFSEVCMRNLENKGLDLYFKSVKECEKLHIEIAELEKQLLIRKELLRHHEDILKTYNQQ